MASLELIQYVQRCPILDGGMVKWVQTRNAAAPNRLLQICWSNGETWGEANLWARELACSSRNRKTGERAIAHLYAYAKWLEAEGVAWWDFPARESDRCLYRFRGTLVRLRDDGALAPSTTSQRMAVVVRFYRWLTRTGLLSVDTPLWKERSIGIKLTDAFGFEHTMRLASTNLAIPNRKTAGFVAVEGGLLPVSRAARKQIVELADAESSDELSLMLRLGFLSGLRIGSITDLKVDTILKAVFDPVTQWYKISLGPAARPPVSTKFGVSGMVPIPVDLKDRLIEYATSTRRLKRQARATQEHRDLLFLNRFGRPYGDDSRAINVEMLRLRKAGAAIGLDVLREFHFHRSRATFATELMRVALAHLQVPDAIKLVKESCLHRDEATTLKYVRFIETSKAMAEAADAFSEAFMGLARAKVS